MIIINSCETKPTEPVRVNPFDPKREGGAYPKAKFIFREDLNNYSLIHYDASDSYDYEDSTNLEYRWDFDGDGNWDTDWITQDTISFEYTSYGDYTVKLSVRDKNLLTSEELVSITVTPKMIDQDGNVYDIVKIGDQWWMVENLKTTHYRNGDPILNVSDNMEWVNLGTGAYCAYNNDNVNAAANGLLYNWYAVDDSRKIAPAGWHVPTDGEWKELEIVLGMSQSEADTTGERGMDEGSKLKATSGWYNNGNGTDESGFSALPGGYRSYGGGTFYGIGDYGYWWSATEYNSSHACYRSLHYDTSAVFRGYYDKRLGFSVRLVRD